MALTVIDTGVSDAVAVTAGQEEQLAALIAPWAGGNVTARVMAGETLLATLTQGPWVMDSETPRKVVLGTRQARTFVAGGVPTRIVFRAGSTDVFQLTAGVGAGDVVFAASITSPALERLDGLVITAAAALPTVAPPVFVAANELRVSLPTGSETNYPFQFGRVFRQGEIVESPRVLLDGTPLTTQADIKTRHEVDGSVKFAVISVVLPSISTTEKVITFQNQAAPAATPATIASMLADFDFGATIDVQSGGSSVAGAPVSARTMLSALTDGGLAAETAAGGSGPRYWTQGPVCTTVLLHDHAAKTYDVGTNATKAIRPMFHVQFWPGIGRYHVRHALEIGDVTKLKDELALTIAFTTGNAAPATRLSQASVNMYLGAWQSRAFWGGADLPRLNIKHGIAYLAETQAMPNYDPAIAMNAAALSSYSSNWASRSKVLGAVGYWNQAMASTGGRPDLGLMPKWDTVALYSGAAHMLEIGEAHAEFAGSWAFYFREGSATKTIYGAALGRGSVVSKLSRPTVYLYDNNAYMHLGDAGDKFSYEGVPSTTRDGWSHDHAHTPGMFWWQYLTTGSAFWHEKLLQLAAWSQFVTNPGLSFNSVGNGNAASALILNGVQPRGYGWQMRNRARAWWAALDGSAEKQLFEQSLLDATAMRVGVYDIPGVLVGNAVRDAWNTNYLDWYGGTPPTPRPNALGYLDKAGGYSAASLPGGVAPDDWNGTAMAGWMHNYITMCLWHAVELGYSQLEPLALFTSRLHIQIANSAEPRHIADFVLPDTKSDGTYYQTLADIYDGYPHNADGAEPTTMSANSASGFSAAGTPNTYTVTTEGYGSIAAAAIAMSGPAPGQATAWAVIEPWHDNTIYYSHDPRYAIVPRA